MNINADEWKRLTTENSFQFNCKKSFRKTPAYFCRSTVSVSTRKRCLDFLWELLKQLEMRLLENENLLKQLNCFHPNATFSQSSEGPLSDFSFRHICDKDVESEYQKVNLVSWNKIFNNAIPDDSEQFWLAVKKQSENLQKP